ncbi:unnamed protein product [Caenorhabditis sp. 36 PRJEB53466]|nr:unnamed protein product [Caenorhabditis sp. 36 PRJEB53466]
MESEIVISNIRSLIKILESIAEEAAIDLEADQQCMMHDVIAMAQDCHKRVVVRTSSFIEKNAEKEAREEERKPGNKEIATVIPKKRRNGSSSVGSADIGFSSDESSGRSEDKKALNKLGIPTRRGDVEMMNESDVKQPWKINPHLKLPEGDYSYRTGR